MVRDWRWRSWRRFFLPIFRGCPRANAPQGGLTGRGTRVTGGSNRRLRVFAVTQIAASFLLLAGACVLMKTLFVLEQTRPPFDSANVLAMNLPVMSYGKTPQQVREFYRDVKARIGALPGVEHVAAGFSVPWRDDQGLGISFTFAAQGAHAHDGQRFPRQVPLRFAGILRDLRRADPRGPRLQ